VETKVVFDRSIVVVVTMGFRERDMIVMAGARAEARAGRCAAPKKQTEEPTR